MNARTERAGPIRRADVARPQRTTPNGPLSALRALWRSVLRASIWGRARQVRAFTGGLVELDERLLKDLGYLRSDVVGMATRRMSADEAVRYRDRF